MPRWFIHLFTFPRAPPPPLPPLHIMNVKSSNYNLKSIPLPAFAHLLKEVLPVLMGCTFSR